MDNSLIRLGIVVFGDVEYGFDLANALNKSGMQVSLFMSKRRVVSFVKDNEQTKERIYDLGLLDQDI